MTSRVQRGAGFALGAVWAAGLSAFAVQPEAGVDSDSRRDSAGPEPSAVPSGGAGIALSAGGEPALGAVAPESLEPSVAAQPAPNWSSLPFAPGEMLEFSLEYGLVKAGRATLEVGGVEELWGRPCVQLRSRAISAEAFHFIFKVDDLVESLFDLEEGYSWRFAKHLREGSYEKDEVVHFDQMNHVARYDDGRVYRIPNRAQDALSALYHVRTLPLEVGKSVFLPNHTDRKNYALEVRVLERERVRTPLGEFDCLVLEPQLQAEGIFRHQGSLKVWVTDDEHRMPVIMKSKVVIGHVAAVLQRRELGAFPMTEIVAVAADPGSPAGASADSIVVPAVEDK